MKAGKILKMLFLFLVPFLSAAQAQERLRLATTTSVQDSGLLPFLLPQFEKKCSCRVDVIAVGTGQALKLASNGDVDMVLVHDPAAEEKFIKDGFGIYRKTFMVNDFVLLGPAADPARIRGMKDAAAAMSRIQKHGSAFISRGDASGTHQRERILWKRARVEPKGSWYLEIGQGMGAVLTMAVEKNAYTICDRATYLARMNRLKLHVLVEGDPLLINYYSAMHVNPERYPSAKVGLSRQLIDWLCSKEGQDLIGSYRAGGHQLFKPAYDSGK
ncbi:MAG: substrate-binding domain-containing protein [Acidobacteria bacterium]|nr:substrate-binding domain-containing protein [Acidobacteriota bacterium]